MPAKVVKKEKAPQSGQMLGVTRWYGCGTVALIWSVAV
jgi:hypothetical protein